MRTPDVALFVHSFAGRAERVAVHFANEFVCWRLAVDMLVQWAVGPYAKGGAELLGIVTAESAATSESVDAAAVESLGTTSG